MSNKKEHNNDEIAYVSVRLPTVMKDKLKGYYQKRGLDLSNGIRSTLYRLLEKEDERGR